MRRRKSAGRYRAFVASLAFLGAGTIALGSDPPDSATNPSTGYIETVDSTVQGGSSEVRHTKTITPTNKVVIVLTSASSDDTDPRIAISPGGTTWVTWWRNDTTPGVYLRMRDPGSGSWDAERRLSSSGEVSRHPRIAHDGTRPWVAYSFESGSGLSVAVTQGAEPSPWPTRTVVASTTGVWSLDLLIHNESGKLWLSWIDASSTVGWSKYDSGTSTWTSASYESYASDSVSAARARIRATVLGL